jgi:hypothetical protein
MALKISMEIISAVSATPVSILTPSLVIPRPPLQGGVDLASEADPVAFASHISLFSHLRFVSAVQEHDPCPYRTGRRTFDTPPLQSCGGPDWVGAPALRPLLPLFIGKLPAGRLWAEIKAGNRRHRIAIGGCWRRLGGGRREPEPSGRTRSSHVAAWLGRLAGLRRSSMALSLRRLAQAVPGRAQGRREVIPLPAVGDGEFDLWILGGSARVWYVVREGLITQARYWSADGREVRAWGEGAGSLPSGIAREEGLGNGPAPTSRRRWRTVATTWWETWPRWGHLVAYALLGIVILLAGVRAGAMTR